MENELHIHYMVFSACGKRQNFENIYDVWGLHLVVTYEKSCYGALHVVHQLWLHVVRKFKDYVFEPKTNGYVPSCDGVYYCLLGNCLSH